MGVKNKKGKPDFRAWANRHLSPGSLPQPIKGSGIGRKRYCPVCHIRASKVNYKFGENKGCYCGECGNQVKEYFPNDYDRLYKLEGKIPNWMWSLLDRFYLFKERTNKKVGSSA